MKQIYDGYYITQDGKIFNKFKKQLSPYDNGKGYLVVNIQINGVRKCKAIHRIVAEAYIPNPNSLPEVNHLDGNRQNNSVANLEWITHGNNIKHSYNLQNRTALGESNANCNTTVDIVVEICQLLEEGLKPSKIRDLGYDYSLIRSIKARRNWKHISYNYNF